MRKKKVVTVKDRRSSSFDPRNREHLRTPLFTVINMKNTTQFRIGEMISSDAISDLIIDNNYEVVIK